MKKKNVRVYFLDVLRFIACLAVIMIHASAGYVTSGIGSFNFFVGNVFDGISRIGVPLFVMISGALMLDEKYDYSKEKMKKHIRKMAEFFIFWSIAYALVYSVIVPMIEGKKIGITSVLGATIAGHTHLWYIWLIIGLYLTLPLLRLWVNDKNKKYVEYFIILSLIFSSILPEIINVGNLYHPIFSKVSSSLKNMNMSYVGVYVNYYILGWYLNNYDIKHKKTLYTLGFLGMLLTFTGTGIISLSKKKALFPFYADGAINVLLEATAIFVFIKNRYSKKTKKSSMILNISKYSLGIYGMHVFFLRISASLLGDIGIKSAIIKIPLMWFIALAVSYILSFLMSKIPLLKRVV